MRTFQIVAATALIVSVTSSGAVAELLVLTNDGIERYDADTGDYLGTPVLSIGNQILRGITAGPDGTLYVSYFTPDNSTTDGVLRFDPKTFELLDTQQDSGGALIPWGSVGGNNIATNPIFGPDGLLYAVVGASIRQHNGVYGDVLSTFVDGSPYQLGEAAFGPDGNIFVTTQPPEISRLFRYDGTTGAFIDEYGFENGGFAFLTTGELFIDGQVFPGPGGSLTGNYTTSASFEYGPDGLLYQITNGTVVRRDGATGASLGTFITGLGTARGIVFTAVPEPSSLAILAVAAFAACASRRPRHHKAFSV